MKSATLVSGDGDAKVELTLTMISLVCFAFSLLSTRRLNPRRDSIRVSIVKPGVAQANLRLEKASLLIYPWCLRLRKTLFQKVGLTPKDNCENASI